jgi:pimeloyl-ACP methyl ester carboxylesterase
MKSRRVLGVALASALAGAGAAAFAAYRRDLARARQRVRSGSVVALTPHGAVEYADRGHGAVVLAVHGAGGGFDQGLDIAGPLAQHGFRVIAVSRFGYLRTPLPNDASPQAQADGFAALLDVLGIDHAAMIGASAGAPSAVQFALRHPRRCRALVLVVPALHAPGRGGTGISFTRRELRIARLMLRYDIVPWVMRRFAPRALLEAAFGTPAALFDRASAIERERVRTMLDHGLPISARIDGLGNDAAVVTALPLYPLAQVKTPTLVLSTPDDGFRTLDSARHAAKEMPAARLVEYADGGHLLVGRYDDALTQIAAFLRAEALSGDAVS